MQDLTSRVASEFARRFGGDPILVQAPGRINLIGEHVDYNLGFVLPGAVDKHIVFAIRPSGNTVSRIFSLDYAEASEFGSHELVPGKHWVNYFMGVMHGFQQNGKMVGGVDCVFASTIPAGAGMSSSAALCCGFGFALNACFQSGLSRLDLARVAQHAEHHFAGVLCGLMDQYASLFGEANSLLLLDCRTNTHRSIPFPAAQCSILLIDTRVKHSLASTAYNDRRAACEEGVTAIKAVNPNVGSLRDVTLGDLDRFRGSLRPEVYRRCGYVVREMERTMKVAAALASPDLALVGQLMFQTHVGLRDEYEVSCAELDRLVELAASHPDLVLGARLMGGGFGGCTINLVRPGEVETFKALVTREYFAFFRIVPEFYTVQLAQGTHRIT